MAIDVLAMDHIYIAVSNLARSIDFYDRVMKLLGFRKSTNSIGGDPHVHYFNRVLQYTLRPADPEGPSHVQHAPGLHHLCFQLADQNSVDDAATALQELGIDARQPQLYPKYAEDYYATFFKDPDGIEIELVNRIRLRKLICNHWERLTEFEDPLSKANII